MLPDPYFDVQSQISHQLTWDMMEKYSAILIVHILCFSFSSVHNLSKIITFYCLWRSCLHIPFFKLDTVKTNHLNL